MLTYMTSICPTPSTSPPICPSVSSLDSSTQSQTWCDGESMSISCTQGKLIEVQCAFYGLDPNLKTDRCGASLLTYSPVCYLSSSLDRIESQCSNKTSCQISDIRSFFSADQDPCYDLDKQLQIQWKCI